MSHDNVEAVQRVVRCFENAEMDAALVDIHPQATLDSGVEVERRGAAVWTLRDGKIVRLPICRSSIDALKAVRLEA